MTPPPDTFARWSTPRALVVEASAMVFACVGFPMERPTLLAMSLVVGAGALGRLHSRSQGLRPAESLAVLTALCAIAITARLALRRAERERWLVTALGSDHALRPLDMPTASLGEGLPALLGGTFRAGPALLVRVSAEGDAYRSAPTDEPVGWLVADPVEVVERARRDARAAWWAVGLQALVLLAANASWLVRRAVPAHGCPERPYASMNGERHYTDRP